MKLKIIFSSLVIFIALQFSPFHNSFEKGGMSSSYSVDSGYNYVNVFENGRWWVYVYDGTVLIDRYLLED